MYFKRAMQRTTSSERQRCTTALGTHTQRISRRSSTQCFPTSSQLPIKVSHGCPPGRSLTHSVILLVISAMKTEKGLALQDLLTGAYEYVETIEFKPQARIYLLDYLATTEYVPFAKLLLYLKAQLLEMTQTQTINGGE